MHRPSSRFRCESPLRVKWAVAETYLSVRCKQCLKCRLLRQYQWAARAAHEQAFAKKTWFITLTFRPAERSIMFSRASAMHGGKPSTVRLVRATGGPVAKFFKRLRKSRFAIRYLCVPELHRDGFPHWHGLIHDLRGDLTWEAVSNAWQSGFSVVKLVRDANALRYVTKYLSKDMHGRVRASLNYGETEAERIEDQEIRSGLRPPRREVFDPKPKAEGEHLPQSSLPVTKHH